MNVDALTTALAAIVRRIDPDAGDEIEAAIAEAMPRLLESDGEDEPGSLSRADLYRIRAVKLIARLSPPGALASPALRRALRLEIRARIGELLGAPLPASAYLDRRGGDEPEPPSSAG
ncbi:MAG: hypothetical protein R3B09_21865 [Nannocystaceae bacterium]